ncbi:MAG: alpha/beta hydrolase, partial [Polyangiaceae bacterium]
MNKWVVAWVGVFSLVLGGLLIGRTSQAVPQTDKPTVVLVHGAFADASSWNGVLRILQQDGFPVVAAANPLRGVEADATAISDLLTSIKGPVVLVGHSYGG